MEMIEQPKKEVEETPAGPAPSPEDIAAHDYKQLVPEFDRVLETLSNRQLKRVIKALWEYPLENPNPRFSYPQEASLFSIAVRMRDCHFTFMNAILNMSKDEQARLAKELEEKSEKPAEQTKEEVG